MKKKIDSKDNIIFLDSIDYVSEVTGLTSFVLPDQTEFVSFKKLIQYAMNLIPKDACVAYAQVHTVTEDNQMDTTIRLMQKYEDGSIQTFYEV